MITDALLGLVTYFAGLFTSMLPAGHLVLPGAGAVAGVIGQVDSLLPVVGLVHVALGVLAAVVAFLSLRFVLVLWNLVYP